LGTLKSETKILMSMGEEYGWLKEIQINEIEKIGKHV
jgi:hypothetical protein